VVDQIELAGIVLALPTGGHGRIDQVERFGAIPLNAGPEVPVATAP
jgi:hypothetical protein